MIEGANPETKKINEDNVELYRRINSMLHLDMQEHIHGDDIVLSKEFGLPHTTINDIVKIGGKQYMLATILEDDPKYNVFDQGGNSGYFGCPYHNAHFKEVDGTIFLNAQKHPKSAILFYDLEGFVYNGEWDINVLGPTLKILEPLDIKKEVHHAYFMIRDYYYGVIPEDIENIMYALDSSIGKVVRRNKTIETKRQGVIDLLVALEHKMNKSPEEFKEFMRWAA